MKVILVIPSSPFLIDDLAMPSLGVMSLSAYIKELGHDVTVIDDVRVSGWEDEEADLWGISITTPQLDSSVKSLEKIKFVNSLRRVIAGGPHATVMPQELLDKGFDQVVMGEGELGLKKILDGCTDRVIKKPYINSLDNLPVPDRDCIDTKKYKYYIEEKPCTTMITSRGCPYGKCAFCCKVWDNTRYIGFSRVREDITNIRRKDFSAVTIFDDIFFSNPLRDMDIMVELNNHGMIWRCISKANYVIKNKSIVQYAGQLGCKEIAFGTESASPSILKNIRKGLTVDMHKRAVDITRESGIKAKVNVVVGLPGESKKTIEDLDKFLGEIDPDWIDVTTLAVYPGSDIYDHPELYDIKFDPKQYLPYKTKSGEYKCMVSTSNLSAEEILEARNYLESKYRKMDSSSAKNLKERNT